MAELTKESNEFLNSINSKVVKIVDYGCHSGVSVTLDNGMVGTGYYPAWKPLKLNISTFKVEG